MRQRENRRIERPSAAAESLNTAGLTRGEVVSTRFATCVLEGRHEAHVVFVCAECGMGKTWLAQDLLSTLERQGYATRYESMAGMDGNHACRRMAVVAREVRSMGKAPKEFKAVVLDDLPAIEECDLAKARRALERMVAAHAFVLVCMRPEAEALAEEMPSFPCLFSSDLADLYHLELEHHGFGSMSSTRDVAALVFHGAGASVPAHLQKKAWYEAVGSLVRGLLRDTLPLEEQRLRLAMMLLGTGGLGELREVMPRLDDEMLEWLSRDTPFFGIDRVQGTFACAGISELEDFEACSDGLREACGRQHETVERACRALAARGDFARLARCFELCDEQTMAEIGCTWGVELVCEGYVSLVERALELFDRLGLSPSPEQRLAAQAVAWVGDSSAVPDVRERDAEEAEDTFERATKRRIVDLLHLCRNLDRCVPSGRVSIRRDDGEVARALVRHIKARRLIFSGKMTEAYALLVNDPLRLSPDTLVSAWLCDDFEIAQALIGEIPREEERLASERARTTMARTGVERLVRYQSMIDPFMRVLVGRGRELEGAEEVAARASRAGDDGIQAIVLMVLAVLDNRQKAYARAHVRAVQATELLTGTNGRHLLLVARFLDALAVVGLGDNGALVALARRTTPSAVRDLAAFMVCQGAEDAENVELSVLERTKGPQDALWMLNMLCNDLEGASSVFREVIPRPWLAMSRRSIKKMQAMVNHAPEDGGEGTDEEAAPARAEAIAAPRPTEDPDKPIGITVLGEFGVTLNGRPIPGACFSRRKARALLTFLAMKREHSMRRFKLLECVWPEVNFDAGRQKIYEATSVVRTAIGRNNGGKRLDPFVGNRSDGYIGLDMSIVTCDVDQFERLAHAALAEDDDGRVVDGALRAISLYRGDLCETPFDATGVAEQRRMELRNLFVDVSVAGAMAAMREDLLPLAVRMAWAAHEASNMREDVVLVLVEALKMAGRILDARNVYLTYARRLLEQTGEPPSASMRSSISKIFPASRGGKPGKGRGSKSNRSLPNATSA